MFELWTITLIHLSAVIIWIGSHLFELLILHHSFAEIPERSKLEIYSPLFGRFRTITGIASAVTLYSGVALGSLSNFGNLSYLFLTPWGVLSSGYFVTAILNHSLGIKPSSMTYRSLRTIGTAFLITAALVVMTELFFPTSLRVLFIYSNAGKALVIASFLAVILSRLGIVQGSIRGQINRISNRLLTKHNGEENSLFQQLHTFENRMRLLVTPETILIFVILGMMIYAGNPF